MESRRLLTQPSINNLQKMFCGNMLAEAERIAQNGYLQDRQDLFMEQG